MRKNYIAEVAKLLGVELRETFKIIVRFTSTAGLV